MVRIQDRRQAWLYHGQRAAGKACDQFRHRTTRYPLPTTERLSMRWEELNRPPCSFGAGAGDLGDHWTLLVCATAAPACADFRRSPRRDPSRPHPRPPQALSASGDAGRSFCRKAAARVKHRGKGSFMRPKPFFPGEDWGDRRLRRRGPPLGMCCSIASWPHAWPIPGGLFRSDDRCCTAGVTVRGGCSGGAPAAAGRSRPCMPTWIKRLDAGVTTRRDAIVPEIRR